MFLKCIYKEKKVSIDKNQMANLTLAGLPQEILLHVFGFLPDSEKLTTSEVCKLFKNIINTEIFWNIERFGFKATDLQERNEDSRKFIKLMIKIFPAISKPANKTNISLARLSIEEQLQTFQLQQPLKLIGALMDIIQNPTKHGFQENQKDHIEAVRLMLEANSPIDLDGFNFSYTASSLEMTKMLIEGGAKPKAEDLNRIAKKAHPDVIKLFLDANVKPKPFLDPQPYYPALDEWLLSPHYTHEVLKLLIEAGAKPSGTTLYVLFHHLPESCNLEMVNILLKAGAKPLNEDQLFELSCRTMLYKRLPRAELDELMRKARTELKP